MEQGCSFGRWGGVREGRSGSCCARMDSLRLEVLQSVLLRRFLMRIFRLGTIPARVFALSVLHPEQCVSCVKTFG